MKLKLLIISLFLVPSLSFSCSSENLKEAIIGFEQERLQNLLDVCEFNVNTHFIYEYDSPYQGYSPLVLSIRLKNMEAIKLLLKQDGIDVNLMNNTVFGERPLTQAVDQNSFEIVKLLLEREDIDINAKDLLSRAPLIFVARRGNAGIFQLFFEMRDELNINTIDHLSRTPLQWAADKNHEGIVSRLLKDSEISLNNLDFYGYNVLSIASFRKNPSIVRKLASIPEININSQDIYGQTALIRAARKGNLENVKILLKRKDIDLSLQDKNGLTAYKVSRKKSIGKSQQEFLESSFLNFNH